MGKLRLREAKGVAQSLTAGQWRGRLLSSWSVLSMPLTATCPPHLRDLPAIRYCQDHPEALSLTSAACSYFCLQRTTVLSFSICPSIHPSSSKKAMMLSLPQTLFVVGYTKVNIGVGGESGLPIEAGRVWSHSCSSNYVSSELSITPAFPQLLNHSPPFSNLQSL